MSCSDRVPIGDASDVGRVRGRVSLALGEAHKHDIFYLAYGHSAADYRRTGLADPSGLEALTLKRVADQVCFIAYRCRKIGAHIARHAWRIKARAIGRREQGVAGFRFQRDPCPLDVLIDDDCRTGLLAGR